MWSCRLALRGLPLSREAAIRRLVLPQRQNPLCPGRGLLCTPARYFRCLAGSGIESSGLAVVPLRSGYTLRNVGATERGGEKAIARRRRRRSSLR